MKKLYYITYVVFLVCLALKTTDPVVSTITNCWKTVTGNKISHTFAGDEKNDASESTKSAILHPFKLLDPKIFPW